MEWLIIGLIFFVLFILPVLFTRIDGVISWRFVFKIWIDFSLLIPLFFINHFLFVPRFLFRKNHITYIALISGLIITFSALYYYFDSVVYKRPHRPEPRELIRQDEHRQPDPIPPYAQLLMYSILIVGVDSGILFIKKWQENEDRRLTLEKENARIQFDILRNQVSPHFLMNTLNNIFALISYDAPTAKDAVMRLSKLMRYMLYENSDGKVSLEKEFDFIRSYIGLMKLRFSKEVVITFNVPDNIETISVPPLLFISYIENAFKYGTSYQDTSFVSIDFYIRDAFLIFTCANSHFGIRKAEGIGGLGQRNNEQRLQLLYENRYNLSINKTTDRYTITLEIPLEI